MSNDKQSSVDKDFIPYEEALALKELGFDEECLDKYDPRFEKLSSDMQTWTTEHYPETLMIPAPLYQQAFRWFREKYKYSQMISKTYGGEYIPYVNGMELNLDENSEEVEGFKWIYKTYEEAELACLKKLIEIVKNK